MRATPARGWWSLLPAREGELQSPVRVFIITFGSLDIVLLEVKPKGKNC